MRAPPDAAGDFAADAGDSIAMQPDLDPRIDRYIGRELDPAASRALAQAALQDDDLFEELTAVAVAQAALESPATTDRAIAQAALEDEDLFDTLIARGVVQEVVEAGLPAQKRPARLWIAGGVAAAIAAGIITFAILRPTPAPTIANTPTSTASILLTDNLRPVRASESPVFRGDEAPSRPPESQARVILIEDGVATINAGSLDGIEKDQKIGPITITTVFRESARGTIAAGASLQVGDSVLIPNAVHLNAVLAHVNAWAASGHLEAARGAAGNALQTGSAGETRQLIERLAELDYQAGAADLARERYKVAVNNFDQPPAAGAEERASTLADYGALSLGDLWHASALLNQGLSYAPSGPLRAQMLNNLGAIAQAQGDMAKASDYYRQALAQNPSPADRAVIAANLARLSR
jgi:hypothetical protein